MDEQSCDAAPLCESAAIPIDQSCDAKVTNKPKRSIGVFSVTMAFLVLLLFGASAFWLAAQQAKKMPESYKSVLEIEPTVAARDGSMLEYNLVRLQNAARRSDPWRVEFTQDQINGWFVSDLPEKFPDSLPDLVQDPRVVIGQNELKFIFKFVTGQLDGFVVVDSDVFCTDVANEVAVKITNVKSGIVPLPIAPWVDRIESVFSKLGVPVYWTSIENDPVAVFSIPEFMTPQGVNQNAVVDSISLQDGKLVVVGQTTEEIEEIAKSSEAKTERH